MTDPATARDRIAFLRGLRNVRRFRPDPIPQPVVDDLLEVARWSGSARNIQPWEFVVIRDRETLRALAAAEGYAGHLAGAALGIVLVMHGNPSQATQETWDEGRLAERIMLAADAHGVGASIGWFLPAGADAVKARLGIPPERTVRTALSLGYPDASGDEGPKPGQGRKPLAELVHEERYGAGPTR
jgi:nitroreductase